VQESAVRTESAIGSSDRALFVPYAGHHAGWLFASGAAGMLLGDIVVGRFLTEAVRERLVGPLRILLAVPYLGFATAPTLPLACVLAFVASIGFAASLPLQERLIPAPTQVSADRSSASTAPDSW
jgi:predicted MFS family arabinose efflux permease